MGANDRLELTRSALERDGVRDVKFCFSLGLAQTPRSSVANSVADFLDAYSKGRFKDVERIGDAVQPRSVDE